MEHEKDKHNMSKMIRNEAITARRLPIGREKVSEHLGTERAPPADGDERSHIETRLIRASNAASTRNEHIAQNPAEGRRRAERVVGLPGLPHMAV